MSAFGMSYEEQKKRGEEIYNAQIRHFISEADADKYVNIDVISGDYEMHENSASAGRILRERRPDAVIHTIRKHKPMQDACGLLVTSVFRERPHDSLRCSSRCHTADARPCHLG